MKNSISTFYMFLILISTILFSSPINKIYSQNAVKHKVRLKVDYVKIMNGDHYLEIATTAKINKKNIKVSNIEISIFNKIFDEKIILGKTKTNMKGKSRFILKNFSSIVPDSTKTYNIVASFKGNDTFKKTSKNLSFKDAEIQANLITKDSINYITATLIDKSTDSVIVDESLDVQIQRLFRPLKIGEEFNNTNDKGTIMVPVEDGIPGIDGNLTIEVVLNDNDDFGTVKALVHAPIGVPIVEESTFDDRTMWSPRNKTPYFLLIVPNLLTFSLWGIIIFLIFNLFKISKS